MNASVDQETGLRDYVLLLWARKLVVIIVVLLAVGGTLAYCATAKKVYTGTSELLLTPNLSPTLLEANGSFATNAVVDVPSDSQIIISAVLRGIVSETIPNAPDASVAEVATTNVVQITTSSHDPHIAAEAANQYAKSYIDYEQKQTLATLTSGSNLLQKHINDLSVAIAQLNTKIAGTGTNTSAAAGYNTQLASFNQEQATLEQELANYQFFTANGGGTQSGQIIAYATVPTKPSSPKTVEWTVLALIIGVILGVAGAMLVEALAE